MSAQRGLQALEAVGDSLQKTFRLLREEFESKERELQELADPVKQMQAVAEAEEQTRKEILRRRLELEAASLRCRAKAAAVRQEQEEIREYHQQIENDIWQVVVWGMDIVPLDVGGSSFEASADTLRRSPWFARRLAAGKAPLRTFASNASAARRRDVLRIERDGGRFKTLLSYLRLGGDAAHNSCGFLIDRLKGADREGLLEEAIFFELHGLAGRLAQPPVGARVELRLSAEELKSKGVDAILLHELCGTWHVPGQCFKLECLRGGAAIVTGQVVAYQHQPDRLWTVECHGQHFVVPRSRFDRPVELGPRSGGDEAVTSTSAVP